MEFEREGLVCISLAINSPSSACIFNGNGHPIDLQNISQALDLGRLDELAMYDFSARSPLPSFF